MKALLLLVLLAPSVALAQTSEPQPPNVCAPEPEIPWCPPPPREPVVTKDLWL